MYLLVMSQINYDQTGLQFNGGGTLSPDYFWKVEQSNLSGVF